MCSSHQDLKYSVKVRLNIKELLPLFVCGDIVRFFFLFLWDTRRVSLVTLTSMTCEKIFIAAVCKAESAHHSLLLIVRVAHDAIVCSCQCQFKMIQ